jgi:DNA-nicking Smr family endonuclease
MGNRRKSDPEDLALWKEVAREATPIKRRAVARKHAIEPEPPAKPKVAAAAIGAASSAERPARPRPSRTARPSPPSPASPAETAPKPLERGQVAGVDRRQAERLKRGRTEIEARIDLHGMTLENAHRRLTGFLEQAQQDGKRAVLVVTGKGVREGTGVIRAQVPRWLNEPRLRPLVLAYEYAQPKDGGMGALYILLRKRR